MIFSVLDGLKQLRPVLENEHKEKMQQIKINRMNRIEERTKQKQEQLRQRIEERKKLWLVLKNYVLLMTCKEEQHK